MERRVLTQWFLRITSFADDLLKGLDGLDWPQNVKAMQSHWIGRSVGATVRFQLVDGSDLSVFTTRVDTLPGVTFLSLAPSHPLAKLSAAKSPEVNEKLAEIASSAFAVCARITSILTLAMSGDEMEGVRLPMDATHPLTGESIPIFVASYVLDTVGTGAVYARV